MLAGGAGPGDDFDALAAALAESGLILRGGFAFQESDGVPPAGPFGLPAKTLLLVGHAGASIWPHVTRWRERRPVGVEDAVDAWSREVVGAVAQKFGARAVFPFERPFLPFQKWASRAEGLKPSPLGILMHPEFGLWHAYRGALLFERELALPSPDAAIHLCDLCDGKPCLSACPVGAYSANGLAYESCLGHLRSGRGESCMTAGCLARNACPFGQGYSYPAQVQAYHQAYFASGNGQFTAS